MTVLVALVAGATAGGVLLAVLPVAFPFLPMITLTGVIAVVLTVGTRQ